LKKLAARIAEAEEIGPPEVEFTNATFVAAMREEFAPYSGRQDVAAVLADLDAALSRWEAEAPGAADRSTRAQPEWPPYFDAAVRAVGDMFRRCEQGKPDAGPMTEARAQRDFLVNVVWPKADRSGYIPWLTLPDGRRVKMSELDPWLFGLFTFGDDPRQPSELVRDLMAYHERGEW
jgi:hypothetical protein